MRITLVYITLLLPVLLYCQKIDNTISYRTIESESYFRFHYDNDYFTATDENYTQGYSFEVVLKILEKNPLNYLFFHDKDAEIKYGLALEHIGFTPNDYVSEDIQFGDRPFASAIMLKSFKVINHASKKSRWSQALSLGLIGSGAFGKEMQVGIHEATGNKISGGWDNQIKNDVILNLRIDFEQQVIRYNDLLKINASSTLQIGTLFTKASIGAHIILGKFNSEFINPKTERKLQIYAYAEPILNVVGYDATLQGGVLNRSSPYTISSNNIERFTAQFNYGLIVKTKTLYFEYTRSAITREFKTGASAKWGGVRIGFTF